MASNVGGENETDDERDDEENVGKPSVTDFIDEEVHHEEQEQDMAASNSENDHGSGEISSNSIPHQTPGQPNSPSEGSETFTWASNSSFGTPNNTSTSASTANGTPVFQNNGMENGANMRYVNQRITDEEIRSEAKLPLFLLFFALAILQTFVQASQSFGAQYFGAEWKLLDVKEFCPWTKVNFNIPSIIQWFNKGMGRIDSFDQLLQQFRPHLKTVTWLPKIFLIS